MRMLLTVAFLMCISHALGGSHYQVLFWLEGFCASDEVAVVSGTKITATSVVGYKYYYVSIPNSNLFTLSVVVKETGTVNLCINLTIGAPTNSLGIYENINICPNVTTHEFGSPSSFASSGYNTLVWGVYSAGTIYVAVYSTQAGINYEFTLTTGYFSQSKCELTM